MAKTNFVKKARKPRVCSVCNKPINIGEPYKYIEPRYKGIIYAHLDCNIPIRMTSSSKMVAIWEAQELASTQIGIAVDIEDISQALRDVAEAARGVSEEYQEGVDNQREYFPDSSVADENEEKAQELESWADEIDSAADDVDNLEAEEPELEEEDYQEKINEAKNEEADRILEEARELASIIDNCPVE